ncbi:MAG: pyruvate ferredoxin oxidoreductase, partial [Deltaproteobacteria bacterium]
EVENGKYRMTMDMPEKRRPIEDYIKLQGRFRHLRPDQIKDIQKRVDREYQLLENKVEHSLSWLEADSEE